MSYDFPHVRIFVFCYLPFYDMLSIKYSSLIYNVSLYTCNVDKLQVRFPCYLFNDVTREVTDRQAHNMCSSHVVVDNVRM